MIRAAAAVFVLAMAGFAVAQAGFAVAQDGCLLCSGHVTDVRFIDQDTSPTSQFVLARLVYNGREPFYLKNWYTDYSSGDKHLIMGLERLSNLDLAPEPRVVAIDDPDLFSYPMIYTSEPGQMLLTDEHAAVLREYLDRGGFWFLDDFWGTFEWGNFLFQLEKVIPNAEIREIPRDHAIFHVFFDIDEIIQVPSLNYVYTGVIVEQDGFEPFVKGIWDEEGRLMMVINHNTDLGDAYEHADDPRYPNRFSSFSYRLATNFIIYALSH